MSDEREIENLVGKYFHYLDDRTPEPWAEMLSDDITIIVYDWELRGREECKTKIFGGQVQGQHGKHIATNTVIKVDGDKAEVVTDYFYIAAMGPEKHIRFEILDFGRYFDTMVKVDGRWLFKEVKIDVELFPLNR
ncbi:MAG: nuclear transport factor 2 family protein [Acidimicrobiales bacterium]